MKKDKPIVTVLVIGPQRSGKTSFVVPHIKAALQKVSKRLPCRIEIIETNQAVKIPDGDYLVEAVGFE